MTEWEWVDYLGVAQDSEGNIFRVRRMATREDRKRALSGMYQILEEVVPESLKHHCAKHGKGREFGVYVRDGAGASARTGATEKIVKTRGRGGGIVFPQGKTWTAW